MRVFSGDKYWYTTSVRHQGVLIFLAADESNTLCYSVYTPGTDSNEKTIELKPLAFPEQLRPVGMGLLTLNFSDLNESAKPAKVPFQAISDGKYVIIFRQSGNETLYVDRFVYVPATNSLESNWETRYQRSRKKDIPASRKDSISYQDMDNTPFREPTTELTMVKVQNGWFGVVLLPTNIPKLARWQIFSVDTATNHILSYSILRDKDGLFDLMSEGSVVNTTLELRDSAGNIPILRSGLATLVYMQQEMITDQYNRQQKVRRGTRTMLSVVTARDSVTVAFDSMAVLDFSVSQEGLLFGTSEKTTFQLPDMGKPTAETSVVMPTVSEWTPTTPINRAGHFRGIQVRSTPYLLDSADGLVHMYFEFLDPKYNLQLGVAQFDTFIQRVEYALAVDAGQKKTGNLRFIGRVPGSQFNETEISIKTDPTDEQLCDVTLRLSQRKSFYQEHWQKVPRQLKKFFDVFNGNDLDYLQAGNAAYSYGENAPTKMTSGSALFSLTFENLSEDNLVAINVPDTDNDNIRLASSGLDPAWVSQPAEAALDFYGTPNSAIVPTLKNPLPLELAGDMTLEAWVSPKQIGLLNGLLTYSSAKAQYGMALQGAAYQSTESDLTLRGKFSPALKAGQPPHTIEAWVNLDGYSFKSLNLLTIPGLHNWTINTNGQVEMRAANLTSPIANFGVAQLTLDLHKWFHLSAVFDGSNYNVYVNGSPASTGEVKRLYPNIFKINSGVDQLIVGSNENIGMQAFKGMLSELRIWNVARSQNDIAANMYRRLDQQAGLIGYWPLNEGTGLTAANLANPDLSATISGSVLQQGTKPWGAGNSYSVITATGGATRRTTKPIYLGKWHHLAATTLSGYALNFGGNDYVDCGNSAQFNPTVALSVEAWVKPDGVGGKQVIVSKYGYAQAQQSYEAGLDEGGKAYFAVVVKAGSHLYELRATSTATLNVGKWNHLVGTFKATTRSTSGTTTECVTQLYVNGELSPQNGSQTFNGSARLNTSTSSLFMGQRPSGMSGFNYRGAMDEVRLWSRELDGDQIKAIAGLPQEIGDTSNLVAYWGFEERSGKTTQDPIGNTVAVLSNSSMWVPSYLTANTQIFVDGELQEADINMAVGGKASNWLNLPVYNPPLLKLGDVVNFESKFFPFFGQMDEVRIWNTVRTVEQIRENLYRPVSSDEAGLVGYWAVDRATPNNGDYCELSDLSGNNNNAICARGRLVENYTAPISNEGPQVLNIFGGSVPYVTNIAGMPIAIEYGKLEKDAGGTPFGILERGYLYKQGNQVVFADGYKVGNLDVQFIGQIQTAPTLIGYIEGAPPVPGENLTAPDGDYSGTSTITLTQADDILYTYSASQDTGSNTSKDYKLGVLAKASTQAGVGVEQEIFSIEGRAGFHGMLESSLGWLNDASVSTGRTKTSSSSLKAQGRWQNFTIPSSFTGGKEVNLRRWVPQNTGLALVRSKTSDLYALQLKKTGATISYQIRPNPDIPEDWNIIMFPLNPEYIQNGLLDGQGWFGNDEFMAGKDRNERSYYRPKEAYRLKAQIEEEVSKWKAYYTQFEAKDKGQQANGNQRAQELIDQQSIQNAATRSVVNTYVWTAGGGLYAEEEQTIGVVEESDGGSYHFLQQGGFSGSLEFAVTGVGLYGEVDALFGGHLDVAVTKGKQSTTSFGLNVAVEADGNIQDDEGANIAGKVTGYRFMTFYLAPDSKNFDDFFNSSTSVVDPRWLKSNNPDAAALKQAQASTNGVWRVLHRVTFVSRVAPEIDANPLETTAVETTPVTGQGSNWSLIQDVQMSLEKLFGRDNPTNLYDLGAAIDAVLSENNPDFSLTSKVRWWGAFLAQAQVINSQAQTLYNELRNDLLGYFKRIYLDQTLG